MDKGKELQIIGNWFGTIGFTVMFVLAKPSWGWPIAMGAIFLGLVLSIASAFMQKKLELLWIILVGFIVGFFTYT